MYVFIFQWSTVINNTLENNEKYQSHSRIQELTQDKHGQNFSNFQETCEKNHPFHSDLF